MVKTRGRIIKGVGGLYTVETAKGDCVVCRARGVLRHEGEKPLVGDFVELTNEGGYILDCVVDRRNCLLRPPAANLDVLFAVLAAAKPQPMLTTLDKLISIAEYNWIEPVVVITKSDLDAAYAEQLREIYEKCGFTVFVCEPDSDKNEIAEYIRSACAGKTCAFAGNSGVGKSTLLNSLFPGLALETGGISLKIGRGRHTTRAIELYPLSGLAGGGPEGYIADTPGFSMLDFTRFDFYSKQELAGTFREFTPFVGKCRYADCTHTREEGCAVLGAIANGVIPQTRHESFLSIWNDIKDKHEWENKR